MKHLSLAALFCLTLLSVSAFDADTILVNSPSMRKDIKAVVFKPASYPEQSQFYPVVYLLHGYSGNHQQWVKDAPQLQQKANELNMILVCPDGGYNSWYIDSPVDTTVKYETFIIRELVPHIDANFRTIAKRAARAITGLSMGGHGALYLASRNQDVFGYAGSICGGVDIRPFPNNWDMKKILGEQSSNMKNWDAYTVINVIEQVAPGKLGLIIDCGLGDFFLDVNRKLHQKLMDRKIDHDYTERPGAHNRAYWNNSIDYQLLFFRKGFSAAFPSIQKSID